VSAAGHNPYAPPAATVSDVEAPAAPRARPRSVTLGIAVLWANAALALLYNGLFLRTRVPDLPSPMFAAILLVYALLGVGIAAWVSIKLARGRNWMRMLLLVVMLIALLSLTVLLRNWAIVQRLYANAPALGALSGLRLILDIVLLALLFTPTANAWFRPRPAAGEASGGS